IIRMKHGVIATIRIQGKYRQPDAIQSAVTSLHQPLRCAVRAGKTMHHRVTASFATHLENRSRVVHATCRRGSIEVAIATQQQRGENEARSTHSWRIGAKKVQNLKTASVSIHPEYRAIVVAIFAGYGAI